MKNDSLACEEELTAIFRIVRQCFDEKHYSLRYVVDKVHEAFPFDKVAFYQTISGTSEFHPKVEEKAPWSLQQLRTFSIIVQSVIHTEPFQVGSESAFTVAVFASGVLHPVVLLDQLVANALEARSRSYNAFQRFFCRLVGVRL